jgi:hypothetical protein
MLATWGGNCSSANKFCFNARGSGKSHINVASNDSMATAWIPPKPARDDSDRDCYEKTKRRENIDLGRGRPAIEERSR